MPSEIKPKTERINPFPTIYDLVYYDNLIRIGRVLRMFGRPFFVLSRTPPCVVGETPSGRLNGRP